MISAIRLKTLEFLHVTDEVEPLSRSFFCKVYNALKYAVRFVGLCSIASGCTMRGSWDESFRQVSGDESNLIIRANV